MLLLLVCLGGAVRVLTLRGESVEGDELFSRRLALLPIQSTLDSARNDLVHPPFYYLLLKAGTKIWGSSPLGIRVWSLLFGVATLPLVLALGNHLPGSHNAGVLAAAMIAGNEYHIFYSQEARSYSLYTFLVTLLALWVVAMTGERKPIRLSVGGFFLMALLLYTHYVAILYVFAIVIAILVCNVPRRTKISVALASVCAGVVFIPWIFAVTGVYRTKHGVGENLDWQGLPSLYDLKAIWASSIGIMEFRGATTLAFCVAAALSVVALGLLSRRQSLRNAPVVVALSLAAIVPPLILFILSMRPFNLPLFGLRHLLPSIVALCVLCCYGLENLAARFERYMGLIFATGSSVLLMFTLVPTYAVIVHGPIRIPYEVVAKAVRLQIGDERQVYTTWPYGIGAPVNYYCGTNCVQPLPTEDTNLPEKIALLYRPEVLQEAKRFQDLLKDGFAVGSNTYYTDGRQSDFGTSVAVLTRGRHP